MPKPKTFLFLAAVVMVLAGAVSGYAYTEIWANDQYTAPAFLVAQLIYESNAYNLNLSGSAQFMKDTSGTSNKDYFYPTATGGAYFLFICSSPADTIRIYIDSDDVDGTKTTGQTPGTRWCTDGTWAGTGYIYSDRLNFDISGTWVAAFNYPMDINGTVTYTDADADISSCSESITEGTEVEGTGVRTTYIP